MITVRALCTVTVLMLANGQPALGQQKWTWRGSLAELDNFDSIIDLSDSEAAGQKFREVFGSPETRHEIVAIHAYSHSEVCERAAYVRWIAKNYGALVLTSNDTGELSGEWFNRLDSACAQSSAGLIADLTDDQAQDIATQLFHAAGGKGNSDSINFVYTTAALPFAKKQAELLGHCRIDEDVSPPSEDTACYHYLSHSFAEEHREFLNLSSASAEDGELLRWIGR